MDAGEGREQDAESFAKIIFEIWFICKNVDLSRNIWNTSRLLHGTHQRVLTLLGITVHLHHLGLGNVTREDSANSLSTGMNMHHDLGSALTVEAEKTLQYLDDKPHRRVIIVEQHHLEHWWLV